MNGDFKFERVVQMLLVALVTAGVAGLWTMTASFARLEERIDNYIAVQRETNENASRRTDQIEERLRMIENRVHRYSPQP